MPRRRPMPRPRPMPSLRPMPRRRPMRSLRPMPRRRPMPRPRPMRSLRPMPRRRPMRSLRATPSLRPMPAMAEPMTIRPLREDELAALAAAVAPQPLLVRYGVTAETVQRLLGEAIARGEPVLAADVGGTARGFAWFQRAGTLGAGGYLRLIALVPGGEGGGLGGALLDAVERDVAGYTRNLFLLVSDWNRGARRFY